MEFTVAGFKILIELKSPLFEGVKSYHHYYMTVCLVLLWFYVEIGIYKRTVVIKNELKITNSLHGEQSESRVGILNGRWLNRKTSSESYIKRRNGGSETYKLRRLLGTIRPSTPGCNCCKTISQSDTE